MDNMDYSMHHSMHGYSAADQVSAGLQQQYMLVCSALGLQDIQSLEGFRSPWYKQLLVFNVGDMHIGVLFLVCKWSVKVRTALRLSRCQLKGGQVCTCDGEQFC